MVKEMDNDGWEMSTKQENIQNAYLLVYDRIVPEAKGMGGEVGDAGEDGEDGEAGERAGAGGVASAGAGVVSPMSLVPPHIFRDVVDANNRFALDRWVYNGDFFSFAKELLATCAGGPEVSGAAVGSSEFGDLVRWGTWVAVELAARASDNGGLDEIVDALSSLYAQDPTNAIAYLEEELLPTGPGAAAPKAEAKSGLAMGLGLTPVQGDGDPTMGTNPLNQDGQDGGCPATSPLIDAVVECRYSFLGVGLRVGSLLGLGVGNEHNLPDEHYPTW